MKILEPLAGARGKIATVGIGVIGYGYWGPNLVRNFFDLEDAQVMAVCDVTPQRLMHVRRQRSVRTTSEYRDLLAMPDVDAVAIATPVSTHYELALASLRAGKHVLVEKPMTETVEQAMHLVEEAARRKLTLMVDHTFVYTPAVQKMRRLVADGTIGVPYYYDSTRVNLGLFQTDVNVIWDLAVHDYSIIDYVLGQQPTAVSANGASHVPNSPENIAYITLYFDSGLIAHINVNWLAPVKVRRTLIGGSQKMVVFDDLEASEKIKVYDKGVTLSDDASRLEQMRVGYRAGDMWAPQLAATEALRTGTQHFVDCIKTGERPITDGLAGARVVQLLTATTRSLQRRGDPIEVAFSAGERPHVAR
jgi:predicted dehydrogenase